MRSQLALLASVALLCGAARSAAPPMPQDATEGTFVIGSKTFTESRLLGEIVAQLVTARTDLAVEHRSGLGGTLICWEALLAGEIDLYPEYTGTAWAVVLQEPGAVSDPLRAFLRVQSESRRRFDAEWLAPFGFQNSYALALREDHAEALGVATISELARVSADLRAGFSVEYLNREDGWPGLRDAYGLAFTSVRGLEHALAYEALGAGELDVIDAYTTDAKLRRFGLRTLRDDRGFYPPYHAAPVLRGETLRERPELRPLFAELAYAIDEEAMIAMNHAVEVQDRGFEEVAREFLVEAELLSAAEIADAAPTRDARQVDWLRLLGEHLYLTFVAVLLAALIAIPLGVWITRHAAAERLALGLFSAVQTVPSLALLAFLIAVPGLGLSPRSAILALTLYAVLPILRNTFTGLSTVAPEVLDAAKGLGLTERQVLMRIQLPLAARTILAGVRTATVISIGVATLAAFIGAGGLGEPIVTGLYLNDVRLILSGAIPAALLALVADKGLALVERRLTPRGLR